MKKFLEQLLSSFSRKILAKYQPDIIGITGSIGKTSTKEAIYWILKDKINVRSNSKNYNNEIGVPLTIIGANSGGSSFLGWLSVILKAIGLILFKDKNYPKILILEMGADKVGDISYLTNFAPCKIGVLTGISESHLEKFSTMEAIIQEKSVIISHLSNDGQAIINLDDENVQKIKHLTQAKVITYGFSPEAIVRADSVKLSTGDNQSVENIDDIKGVSFKLIYNGSTVPVFLPKVVGRQQVYSVLAAIACGFFYNLNLVEMINSLKSYQPPKGRMNLLKGIKYTLIIDDTYNASPASTMAALEAMKNFPVEESGKKKWAVLGDMLELGSFSEQGHFDTGKKVFECGVDYLVSVGDRSHDISRGAISAGMPENQVFHFDSVQVAGDFVESKITKGDLILVKGSQGMRMEKIVKDIMAEPLRAEALLVRQEEAWLKK